MKKKKIVLSVLLAVLAVLIIGTYVVVALYFQRHFYWDRIQRWDDEEQAYRGTYEKKYLFGKFYNDMFGKCFHYHYFKRNCEPLGNRNVWMAHDRSYVVPFALLKRDHDADCIFRIFYPGCDDNP